MRENLQDELVLFFLKFNVMISQGVPIEEVLIVLEKESTNERLRQAAKEMNESIMVGKNPADAMENFPDLFDKHIIQLVRVGCEMGMLDTFSEIIPKNILYNRLGEWNTTYSRSLKELREKELIKDTFGRYVSHQVAEKILQHPEKLEFGGERREVSILFADIRGFTPYAESHTPEEVVATLNEYFSVMIDVIFKNEGTLDKFMGDCIMAIFGAPIEQPDHAIRSVKTAIEMQDALKELNKRRIENGKEPINVGIGVNSGEAVVGNVGSQKRVEYSAIGDIVNVASRLETTSAKGQILIGSNTYEKIKEQIKAKEIGPVYVKGRTEPVMVYEVEDIPQHESLNY
ncbi:MAG: adenylate/guanylate cyclase domain-containing protein [Elusimicrobiota bacterium]